MASSSARSCGRSDSKCSATTLAFLSTLVLLLLLALFGVAVAVVSARQRRQDLQGRPRSGPQGSQASSLLWWWCIEAACVSSARASARYQKDVLDRNPRTRTSTRLEGVPICSTSPEGPPSLRGPAQAPKHWQFDRWSWAAHTHSLGESTTRSPTSNGCNAAAAAAFLSSSAMAARAILVGGRTTPARPQ